MWTCKHCNEDFDFERTTEKANHTRWCFKNPKSKQFRIDNANRAKAEKVKEFGPYTDFKVICDTCDTEFSVTEREKLFPQKEKYYCCRNCANSVGGTAKALKYHPDDVAHYKAVMLRYNEHKCLCCGFDKIVAAHHVDGNHNNNDPKNLVPLCPNCHAMMHSRYRDEVQLHIEIYLKNKWG